MVILASLKSSCRGSSRPTKWGRATVLEVQLEFALWPHVLVPFSLAQPCARRGGSSAEDFPKRLFGLGKMVELAQSLPRSSRSMWRRAWLLGNFRLPPKVADSKLQGGSRGDREAIVRKRTGEEDPLSASHPLPI